MNDIRQKNQTRAGIFALLFAVCFALLLPGCRSPLEPQQEPPGTLSVAIAQGAGRTIAPDTTALNDFARLRLEFTGATAVQPVFWNPGAGEVSGQIPLPPGTWGLHVTAYLDDGNGGFLSAAEGYALVHHES